MSIIDKHPAPWRMSTDVPHYMTMVEDANGTAVIHAEEGCSFGYLCSPEEEEAIKRLILAAPVLLKVLQLILNRGDLPRDQTPFNLLVGWLNGEKDCPPIDLGAFMKWLDGEPIDIIARIEGET